MGFWDVPYKKIIEEAPPQFGDFARIALAETEKRGDRLGLDPAVQQCMKTAVVAALAIAANRQLGIWSTKAMAAVVRRGDYAAGQLPRHLADEVRDIADLMWSTFRFLMFPEKDPSA